MKILITGGSGFVGSTLCDELCRQGHEVSLLMRKTSARTHLTNAKFTAVEGDLRDKKSLEKAVKDAEIIFHVAGVVSARSKAEFFKNNADGTANLAEAAVSYAKQLRRFVYVSSLAAGGPTQPGQCRVESDTPHPVSHYGESKLAGEDVLRRLNGRLPSIVIRPPAVYGPRDKGIYTFFQVINRGVRPSLGCAQPDPRRYSFVHVDDLVQGIIAAGLSEKKFNPAETFYISGDGEYSWDEAMSLIAQGLQKNTIRLPLPLPVMSGVATLCGVLSKISGKTMPLSPDKMNELKAMAWTCKNQKAKEHLGFQPQWSLDRGLKQTAEWYVSRGWL